METAMSDETRTVIEEIGGILTAIATLKSDQTFEIEEGDGTYRVKKTISSLEYANNLAAYLNEIVLDNLIESLQQEESR